MKAILTGLVMTVISFTGFSQNRWSAEFRPGLNFPSEQIIDVDISTGFGFEATLAFRLFSYVHAYAGWSWNEFRTDAEINPVYLDLEESGFSSGLQFILPLGESRFSYILKGGGIYNRFELEDIEGNVYADSGYSFGWQVETGIGFNINTSWSLRPLVRYRTSLKQMEILNVPTQADLNYFSIAIGLVKRF